MPRTGTDPPDADKHKDQRGRCHHNLSPGEGTTFCRIGSDNRHRRGLQLTDSSFDTVPVFFLDPAIKGFAPEAKRQRALFISIVGKVIHVSLLLLKTHSSDTHTLFFQKKFTGAPCWIYRTASRLD